MNQTISDLLQGNSGDYIFPFFWQHGEDEGMLRKMMKVIHDAGCKSVCIESRPHPDFCGEKWWKDMDVILDEARKKDMKVWILDDSHFPTGYANGAVKNAPVKLHRQSVASSCSIFKGKERDIELNLTKLFPPKNKASFASKMITNYMSKDVPVFDDDEILSVVAMDKDGNTETLKLSNTGKLRFHKKDGEYKVYVTGLSRNMGIHRQYINMMSKESCRILIDTVYEAHYRHYKEDFGKTILGFFSDEPELGNGIYMTGANGLGTQTDLPWSDELQEELKQRLGENYAAQLLWLWDNDHPEKAAKIRYAYMDAVTKLVRKDFSEQIGNWCREHGVKYIGHVIEDNNAHSKTGMSLGHYFRGLNGQDMSGIDDIGGQVLPQGEDLEVKTFFGKRDGEFYHFALGNLAASAAAIDVKKNGDSMCEIFGNYGWSEGVRLEKYLCEHFMVRGINHFVPHAFTGKAFPDPDCPPHFYAQGHNPQYRHFGKIVEYMNRVSTLTSNGHRDSKVAVLYNGEFEWMGASMPVQKPLRKLYEDQLMVDTIPFDVFTETERYDTRIEDKLYVNNQAYEVLIIPKCEFINKDMKEAFDQLNIPVIFVDALPKVVDEDMKLNFTVASLEDLSKEVRKHVAALSITPADKDIRLLQYTKEDEILYFFNEADKAYEGKVSVDLKDYYEYDAWNNRIYKVNDDELVLEPNKGRIFVKGKADEEKLSERIIVKGERHELSSFERSVCKAIDYPQFENEKTIQLPDDYAKENKYFSGIIAYEKDIEMPAKKKAILEITDAYEGVEVFVNGISLGIQVVPSFVYDLSDALKTGNNKLRIEVATTLERQMAKDFAQKMRGLATGTSSKPKDPIGINGKVSLYLSD